MEPTKVYLGDLTHTGSGIMAMTFPLGTSYVTAYAKQELGDRFDFQLFKFPDPLSQAIRSEPPAVLALSNYSWNLELGYKLSVWAKQHNPNLVVIFGGPNFPVEPEDKLDFLQQRSAMDFYVELEGEVGFTELLRRLESCDFNVEAFKQTREEVGNCIYACGDELIAGEIERISDVNIIPSPYLTGLMDEFFDLPLSPMLETTRGCPFTCTFCVEGQFAYSRVKHYDSNRVQAELRYMAERVKSVNELTLADSNFGMNKWDIGTAQAIAEMQAEFQWPTLVNASTGKNRQERIIETITLLKGSWIAGSSVQSSDQEILKNVKRSNISMEAYGNLMHAMNSLDNEILTYSEIILGLPGDTKRKHFESLRHAVDNEVNRIHMYEATMLTGSDMTSQETRDTFGLVTKFRLIPGGVGLYEFGDDQVRVAEIEEIIVGGEEMPFEDYLSCRIMHLLIETFINNGLCEEFFAAMRSMEISIFDFFIFLHQHDELYTDRFREIVTSFLAANTAKLYDSYEEAESSVLDSDAFEHYLAGDLGTNELLEHRALLIFDLEDSFTVLLSALKLYLDSEGLLNVAVWSYFEELGTFILCKKQNVQQVDLEIQHSFSYDFLDIEEHKYMVNPTNVKRTDNELGFKFFHHPSQKEQILNAVSMYENHPDGISRMLARENLKKLYRDFERV